MPHKSILKKLICFIILFSLNCIGLRNHPEFPKPLKNVEKIKVCGFVRSKTSTNNSAYTDHETGAIYNDLKNEYFEFVPDCNKNIYEVRLYQTWEFEEASWFMLSALTATIIPSYRARTISNSYNIAKNNKVYGYYQNSLERKEYIWLPFFPVNIYQNFFDKDIVGIEYSENVYLKIKEVEHLAKKDEEIEQEATKKQQEALDNFKKIILSNLKKENVLVLNDLKDNFNLAHFNKKDFPGIFNSVELEGDEFDYQRDKSKLSNIRNQKYLLIQPNACNDYISEYDFSAKSFRFSYNTSSTKGALPFGLGAGYRYDKMYSNEVMIPVPEGEAKEFKTSKKICELLVEVMPTEISDTVYKCKIDAGGGDESTVLADKDTYNSKIKNKFEFHSCTSSVEKIKKLKLKIIRVGFIDSTTNKIYTN